VTSTAGQRSTRVKTERSTVSLSDFAKELVRLEDASESKNLLIYGDSNVGKTVLAGTCPGRTFWLVGEPGYKSAGRMGARGYGRVISDTATALAAVTWLEYKERYRKLDWLVLDGLSTMQDRFRLAYAAEAFDVNPTKRQHRNLPDKPDYFNTQNFLKSWIPQLVDMPVNLLITAHAYRTDGEDAELLVFPGIQGKTTETANAISGLMDVTAYFEKKRIRVRDSDESKVVRRLWFDSPARRSKKEDEVRYICGDKFNVLGQYMDNPTMPKLLAKIDGGEEA
jgi:AAA domain